MTTKPLKKGATYDDLVRVPEHFVAEIFDGELYASPRPAYPHSRAAGVLYAKLGDAFDFVWKSNRQNMDLIRTRATGEKGTGSDYAFVFLIMGLLVALLIASILASVYVIYGILWEIVTGNI